MTIDAAGGEPRAGLRGPQPERRPHLHAGDFAGRQAVRLPPRGAGRSDGAGIYLCDSRRRAAAARPDERGGQESDRHRLLGRRQVPHGAWLRRGYVDDHGRRHRCRNRHGHSRSLRASRSSARHGRRRMRRSPTSRTTGTTTENPGGLFVSAAPGEPGRLLIGGGFNAVDLLPQRAVRLGEQQHHDPRPGRGRLDNRALRPTRAIGAG